ncbi:5'-methylthioadenosine/adenosylhomocysteine nucleosidase, partial [Helicobacter pylori]
FGVPCCVLRSISDNADEEAGMSFDEFLEKSAQTSAKFLKSMVDKL